MNPLSILEHDEILKLHEAAVSAGLADKRMTLLGSFEQAFTVELPIAKVPGEQILSDLQALNRAVGGPGEDARLAIWLKGAVALSKTRNPKEAAIFEAAIERCRSQSAIEVGQAPAPESDPLRRAQRSPGGSGRILLSILAVAAVLLLAHFLKQR